VSIAQELLNDSMMIQICSKVTTGDETWIYGYDVESKAQSSQWRHSGSPRPKKARLIYSTFVDSLFSKITMVWCIMHSCQKVALSIKNINLKLCTVCMKQYKKTPEIVEKPVMVIATR
jgi:hypothetical protein